MFKPMLALSPTNHKTCLHTSYTMDYTERIEIYKQYVKHLLKILSKTCNLSVQCW